MADLMQGLNLILHQENKTTSRHHLLDVYRDHTCGRLFRFHVVMDLTGPNMSYAHIESLSGHGKWEVLHFLIPAPPTMEDALTRLWAAAGALYNWKEFRERGSEESAPA